MHMRMIHVSTCPLRNNMNYECITWLDQRREFLALVAPSGYTIIITIYYQSMPMDGCWLFHVIDDSNGHWLVFGKYYWRAWNAVFPRTWFSFFYQLKAF